MNTHPITVNLRYDLYRNKNRGQIVGTPLPRSPRRNVGDAK